MLVEFLGQFSKDLDKINRKSVKSNIIRLIGVFESSNNLHSIPNLKKLAGHKSAYRIRIGDYRLGFFFEGNKIIIARVVHRKDIYKVFP